MSGQLIGPIGVLPTVVGGGGSGPLVYAAKSTFTTGTASGISDQTTGSLSIGTSTPDRVVILTIQNMGAGTSANSQLDDTKVKMNSGAGATTMTPGVKANDGRYETAIYYLADSSGSSTAIFQFGTVGGAGWSDGFTAQIGIVTGSAAATWVPGNNVTTAKYVQASPTTTATATLTVPTNGVGLISGLQGTNVAVPTWTNAAASASDADVTATAASSSFYGSSQHTTATASVSQNSGAGSTGLGWVGGSMQP